MTLYGLNISCEAGQVTLNVLLVNNCRNLRQFDISGLKSSSFTGVDLSSNTKLETLPVGDISLIGVIFTGGASLIACVLPTALRTPELRYLSKLTDVGLQLEDTTNIMRLMIDNYNLIDWNTSLQQYSATNYLRIIGIDTDGDRGLSRELMTMGGVDGGGGNV